jgi:hypothetical protein
VDTHVQDLVGISGFTRVLSVRPCQQGAHPRGRPTPLAPICILYSPIFCFALHVSGAICTHPQEHRLQSTAIGVCNGYDMLIRLEDVMDGTPSYF